MGQPRIVRDMSEISHHISKNIEISARDNTHLFAEAYLDLSVMDAIVKKLKENESNDTTKVLGEAIWDMFSSIYLSASGLYRSSFMALRSALELGLAYIYFCDNNYDYLLWKKSQTAAAHPRSRAAGHARRRRIIMETG